jgi:hypothetical protein
MERIHMVCVSVASALLTVICISTFGCSSGGASAAPISEGTQTTTGTTPAPQEQEMVPAFVELADEMGTVPVFGLTSLPGGMEVSSEWWPVVEQWERGASQEISANPRVEGASGGEPQGELLLKCGDGWLDVLANFRGDLGDVSGESLGEVSGMPAYLYQVGGGWLVQWSYEGRWYGVFGRGVPRDVVTSTALGMRLVERY